MGDLNYIKVCFSFMTLFIILMGSLLNSFEKYLPTIFKQTFRYGKFAYKGRKIKYIKPLEVPKSWFRHFYIFSSILSSTTLALMVVVLVLGSPVPKSFTRFLNLVAGSYRRASVSGCSSVLAMSLLMLQCWRRFYDTQFVSVYGKYSRMNMSHYVIGFTHYVGAVLAILVEAPKFSYSSVQEEKFSLLNFTYSDVSATIVFIWAWWHQYKVTVILADLRKNEDGVVITQTHKLPHGDWFKYVSSPHILAEILMYLALTVILWNNITWLYVFAWVLSNQVETALLSHWWYQETFPELPKQRKAIIPFIY